MCLRKRERWLMTNRILSTGQRIFTLSLHTWPWNSDASERSARRAKKRAPPSWLCEVANDRAEMQELLRSSCRDSWHVTLRKNVPDARVAWAEGFYVGHVFQRRIITFTLFHKTSKAVIIWSAQACNKWPSWLSVQKRTFYIIQFTRSSNSGN